ncbi:MAG: ATP-binding protein [Gallionella sp.]|nr:ATP-binding protein [Gallionella sp.]
MTEPTYAELKERLERAEGMLRTLEHGEADAVMSRDGPGLVRSKAAISMEQILMAELRESKERYHTLFNSIDEGFCLIEMIYDEHENPIDWRFLETNPAFEKQTGLRDGVGKRMRELAPDHEAHWFETYGEVARTGEPIRFQNEAKELGGRWFDLYAFRIGESGSYKVAVLFRDITDFKNLEQAQLDRNIEMETATAVAEKANLAKSDFLSSMSHELRTPLNAILGFAQLLEAGTPSPTAIQMIRLNQISQGGWYLLRLINEILDLALIESGKSAMSLEPVSLSKVLLECQAMFVPQAAKNSIHLHFHMFDNAWFVHADQTKLKQVLTNLLSNAIKYNSINGTVEVKCSENTPGRLRISVKDSGDGLSAEKLAQLFQPFNRLGQEVGVKEGTGIGLTVSKKLVEMMGGTIGVESRVGVGSEFWIELERDIASQPAATIRPPGEFVSQPTGNASRYTLLYVEDNSANLMLVEQIIEDRPHIRMISARDGARGVALAQEQLPDIILMDINLPVLSGIEAMTLLRRDPATKHIPIIALSANAMTRDIERGVEAGFFRYLTKPIKINEFTEALDAAMASVGNQQTSL